MRLLRVQSSLSLSDYRYLFVAGLIAGSLMLTGCGNEPTEPRILDAATREMLSEVSAALEQHDYNTALALVDGIEERHPGLSHAHFMRGRILSELGDLREADEQYRLALRRNPDYRGAWNNLANNAARQDDFLRAIEYYAKEFELHPEPAPLRAMGRAYQEIGDVDSALEAFERALAMDSTYAPVYLSISMLYQNEGEYENALEYARRALSLDSNHIDYRYRTGSIMVTLGMVEEGIEHLQAVVERWPWYHAAHNALGQAYARLGREDEANQFLEKAEEARAHAARIEHLQNSIRVMPDNAHHRASLGQELRRAGRYDEAMQSYQVAHFLAPNDDAILTNMANLHLVMGDTLAAIRQYESIVQQFPEVTATWVNLGILYAISGHTDHARRAWEQALHITPDHEAARAYLARLSRESE